MLPPIETLPGMNSPAVPTGFEADSPWRLVVELLLSFVGTAITTSLVLRVARRWPRMVGRLGICLLFWGGMCWFHYPPWPGFRFLVLSLFSFGFGFIALSKGYGTISLFIDDFAGGDVNESYQQHSFWLRQGFLGVVAGQAFGYFYAAGRFLD